MALIEIDARPMVVILDCPGCGPPAPLRLHSELKDPDKTAAEHAKATGHKPKVLRHAVSYITLVIGPSSHRSGPMPLR